MHIRQSASSVLTSRARAVAAFALPAVAVVALCFGGGASIEHTSLAAVLVWWTVLAGVASGAWPAARVPRAAALAGLALAAFTLLTAASIAWAPSAERALAELLRVTLYLGTFALVVLAVRPGEGAVTADGIAAGISVAGVLALAQRLVPGFGSDGGIPELLPEAAVRLSYPLGYWNGLGIFAALALPLLLRAAVATRPAAVRGLAVLPVPALAAAVYLTSSRGGVAAAVAGAAVFLLLGARRLAAVQALAVAACGSAGAIAILSARPALVDGPLTRAAVEADGPGAALLIAAVCVATAVLYGLLAALAPALLRVSAGLRWAVTGAAVVIAAAAVLAADPAERVEAFKAPPEQVAGRDFVRSHLLSGGGSGRWQFWGSALDQVASAPVVGGGAGSFEPWWARHGSLAYFVRNAHSLWLETLGELGIAGGLLLAAAFALGLSALPRRLAGAGDDGRALAAALAGVVVAFALGAALDWVWQLPVVAVSALACLALLCGPATLPPDAAAAAPPRARPIRIPIATAALAAITLGAMLYLGDAELRRSRAATSAGSLQEAADHAARARALAPWASSPRLQQALVRELDGDLAGARAAAAEAIAREPENWRPRLVAARLATKAGAIREARASLRAARRLNPRSLLLTSRLGAP